ncbi:ABC transporter ATP-binding protein [candidate division KSB3 bacterium]|uniref:ABC transporter ATP-binding protein n=1 Tax=candidate division KSB3 bacterium TaxID=2044937 RepID=A0A2G6KAF1_9BACT|nr:MAG: ABC transporter ATP-binding protein [candidate division KSB3 bacterium]
MTTLHKKPVLTLAHITKVYPGVVALDSVDFTVYEQEVIGLVGENGAGKSTLMKVMIGLVQPDDGTIAASKGDLILLKDPSTAIRYGIGMVFQEGSLIPNLSIMENLFLCHEQEFQHAGFLSKRTMRKEAKRVLEQVNIHINVNTTVDEISPAMRQMIEIARLLWLSQLYKQANPILILDEPTTVLTDSERDTLFAILDDIKQHTSVILISHRLQEIVDNSDRIVILKDGKNVTEMAGSDADIEEIEHLMVGHTFSADRYLEGEQRAPGKEECLGVRNLSKNGVFDALDFTVRAGEIVSLVGLVGSGKEAVCQCINGLEKADTGEIFLDGKKLPGGSPGNAVGAGIGHIPIDRREEGLATTLGVQENINLLVLRRLKRAGIISPLLEQKNARHWIGECQIKTPSLSTLCANLSGGNQQKIVIAKWLSSRVRLLVLDHPTRGVDVGAKEEIYKLIRQLAKDGISMVIMCDTLEEDIGLSNRMLIMKDGRLVKEVACPPNQKPSPGDIIEFIV